MQREIWYRTHLLIYLFVYFPTFFSCFWFTQTLMTRMQKHQGMPQGGMWLIKMHILLKQQEHILNK